jgi:ribosomal protein S13
MLASSTLRFAGPRGVTDEPPHRAAAPDARRTSPAASLSVSLTVSAPWRTLTGRATHGTFISPPVPARGQAARVMTLDDIATGLVDAAAQAVGVPDSAAVLSDDRRADVALARHLTIVIARRHGFTLTQIGARLNRSHASCSVAARKLADRSMKDPEIAALLARVDWLWRQSGRRVADRVDARSRPAAGGRHTQLQIVRQPAKAFAPEPPASARELAARFGRLDAPADDEPLRKANAVRTSRAHSKRAINALDPPDACRAIAGALHVGAWWVLACTAGELLCCVHGLGAASARALCRQAHVAPGAAVAGLRDAERRRLANVLSDRAQHGPQRRRPTNTGGDARQRAQALEQASRTRRTRGQVRRDIARAADRPAAMALIAGLVRASDRAAELGGMPIADALSAVHGVGETRAQRLCERAGITAARTFAQIDRLSAARRQHIIDVLCDIKRDSVSADTGNTNDPRRDLDAAPLLAWIDDLRLRPRADSREYRIIRDARASGRITLAAVDTLLDRLDRQEMLAVLYASS